MLNPTSRMPQSVPLNVPDLDQAFPGFLHDVEQLVKAGFEHQEAYEVKPAFLQVIAQAIALFRREDEVMTLCRDRAGTAHRAAHKRFLEALQGLNRRYQEEGPSIPLAQDMKRELQDWMRDHRLLMDAALGRLVQDVVSRSISHYDSSHPGT